MNKIQSLLYYSATTDLAYRINKEYYQQHFVWCSPVFDPTQLDKLHSWSRIPGSSSPKKIYYDYLRDVTDRDDHSKLIEQNKLGILRGATYMYAQNVISEDDLRRITYIVEHASYQDFSPLLYVISGSHIKDRINRVPVEESANPLSVEYRIADLKDGEFDVIKICS